MHFIKATWMARTARSMVCATLLTFGFATTSSAQISFMFDYSANAPGVGFLDPVNGPARQTALQNAGNLFSNMFGQYFTTTGSVVLRATSSDDATSPTLASAGSVAQGNGTPGFTLQEVVMTKLQTGNDINGLNDDGVVNVNWGKEWSLDPNTPATGSQFDLFAALDHEFTHALGFSAFINQNGTDPFGGNSQWSPYAKFLKDKDGNDIIDHDTFQINQAVWDAAKVGGTGTGVQWDGPAGVAAYGGDIPLYSPTTYRPGSSISHLDTPLFQTSMMKHDRGRGPNEARDYNAVEIGIMTDLGYVRGVVPAPSSALVLLIGAVPGVSIVIRRRRSATASRSTK